MLDIITIHQGPTGILSLRKKDFFAPFCYFLLLLLSFSFLLKALEELDLHVRAIPWKTLKNSLSTHFLNSAQSNECDVKTVTKEISRHMSSHFINKKTHAHPSGGATASTIKGKTLITKPIQFSKIFPILVIYSTLFYQVFTCRCPVSPQVRFDLVVIQEV